METFKMVLDVVSVLAALVSVWLAYRTNQAHKATMQIRNDVIKVASGSNCISGNSLKNIGGDAISTHHHQHM